MQNRYIKQTITNLFHLNRSSFLLQQANGKTCYEQVDIADVIATMYGVSYVPISDIRTDNQLSNEQKRCLLKQTHWFA